MDLTGNWNYSEDFEFGNSKGECKITQENNSVFAEFHFTEQVSGDYKIDVYEKTKGEIIDGKLLLESIEVLATDGEKNIGYLPNTYELHLVSDKKLVGSTFDDEIVCGVFVLDKISNF
jgi:hypothetical protein